MSSEPIDASQGRQAMDRPQVAGATGLVNLPQGTIEHDVAILDRFQQFSAELLRLALLGIAAIGVLVSKAFFSELPDKALYILRSELWVIGAATLVFLFSALAALAHRYVATDGMTYHINSLRLHGRGKKAEAASEEEIRDKLFDRSETLIKLAAGSLLFGVMISAAAVFWALWALGRPTT